MKNGVNRNLFKARDPTTPEARALAGEFGVGGRFVAAYVGTHGMAHHLDTILEAAAIIGNDDILFVMVGDGAERERLVGKRQAMGLKNVVMLEQLPKGKMPALWSLTNVSLVLLKKSDLFRTVIPSKIFESMAMEVPVVLGVEGEAQAVIEEAGAGICIEPEDPQALASAVRRLCAKTTLSRSGSGPAVAAMCSSTLTAPRLLRSICRYSILRFEELHPVQIKKWKTEIRERAATLLETNRDLKEQERLGESERLNREIGRLTM